MAIVKWSPIRELEEMRKDLDKIFGELVEPMTRRRLWPRQMEAGAVVPNVDFFETKSEFVVKADLPGVEKENVDITITTEALTIKGEIKKDETVKEEDYYSRERVYGNFTRTIPLPAEVDASKTKATFKNGVLEIVLPKKEEAKAKEIKVQIS